MIEIRKSPGPAGTGSEANSNAQFTWNEKQEKPNTQAPELQDEEELREALLSELRCDLVLSKMDTFKIERLGIALKHRLISVRQCLARQVADDTAAFHDVEECT